METQVVVECEPHLCATCQEIFQSAALVETLKSRDSDEDYCQHDVAIVKTEFIGETARLGCPICLRLYNAFSREDQTFLEEELFDACKAGLRSLYNESTSYRFIFSDLYGGVDLRLQFQYDTGMVESDSRYLKASLLLLQEEGGLDPKGINRQPTSNLLEPSASSSSSWDTISKWMDECQFNHTSCRKRESFIPTRLIDVGPAYLELQFTLNVGPNKEHFGPIGGKIHLVTRENVPAGSSYIALSHCWGGYTPTTLRIDNIQAMKDGISVDILPKTFRDAVAVTRRFHIRYLWIDCICIIQDSLNDWKQESAMMYQVYSNCFINIAATAAQNARVGLFFDRNASLVQSFQISIKREEAAESEKFYIVDYDLCRNFESQPMCQRGWFCQERVLSPRTIHFSSRQLFWECRGLSACESFPSGLPAVFRSDMTKSIAHHLLRENRFPLESTNDYAVKSNIDTWFRILRLYTKASLTFETDKLVAIAGIAHMMHNELGPEYLAGLWKPHLLPQLLWRSGPNTLTKRYSTYIAPSWSWASVDGPTQLDANGLNRSPRDNLVDVLGTQVSLSSKSPFGQVCGGVLQLRGHLAEARSVERFSVNQQDLSFFPLKKPVLDSWVRPSREFYAHPFRVVVDVGLYPSNILDEEMKRLFLLPVTQDRHSVHTGCYGLVLRETENRGKRDEFCRWGYFKTSTEEGISELCRLTRAFDAMRAESSELKYQEGEKWGRKYDITIV